MEDICGNCKHYNENKTFNNCEVNVVGKVKSEEYGCYKIQFSKKYK